MEDFSVIEGRREHPSTPTIILHRPPYVFNNSAPSKVFIREFISTVSEKEESGKGLPTLRLLRSEVLSVIVLSLFYFFLQTGYLCDSVRSNIRMNSCKLTLNT